jgi:hypothetical protein
MIQNQASKLAIENVQSAKLWSQAHFRAWLRSLGDPDYLMALTRGYFDESLMPEKGTMIVAGCLFDDVHALRFKPKWDRLWRKYGGCHMADFVARQGPYKGISDEEHHVLMVGSVALLTKHVDQAVAISCEVNEAAALCEPLDGFRSPYGMCSTFAVGGAMLFWRDRKRRHETDRVAYVFEAGHKDAAEVSRFLHAIATNPVARKDYLYGAHSFRLKEEESLLQAPDFFAWEMNRFMTRSVLRKDETKKPMRKSFGYLWSGWKQGNRVAFRHLDAGRLAQHKDILRHLVGDLK